MDACKLQDFHIEYLLQNFILNKAIELLIA